MRLYFAGMESRETILDRCHPPIDVLVSFADLRRPPDRSKCRSVFLDSGAFSAWSVGRTIALADYIRHVRERRADYDAVAGLDVIGDWQASKRNFLAMRDAGLEIVPCYHIGEPTAYWEWMLSEWPYVAIGGMVPYLKSVKGFPNRDALWTEVNRLHRIARPTGVKLHGFGCTVYRFMADLDWHSVDSTTWMIYVRYKKILTFEGDTWSRPMVGENGVCLSKTSNRFHPRAVGRALQQAGIDRSPADMLLNGTEDDFSVLNIEVMRKSLAWKGVYL